jgi:hypothetical protein
MQELVLPEKLPPDGELQIFALLCAGVSVTRKNSPLLETGE